MLSIIWKFLMMILWLGIIFYCPYHVNFNYDSPNNLDFNNYSSYIIILISLETIIKLNTVIFT